MKSPYPVDSGFTSFEKLSVPAFGKKLLHIVLADADPGIGNREPHHAVHLFHDDVDLSGRRVANGIVEKIPDDVSLDLLLIAADDAAVLDGGDERKFLNGCRRAEFFDHAPRGLGEVERFRMYRELSAFGAGAIENGHHGLDAFLRVLETFVRERIERRTDRSEVALDDRRERRFAFREVAFDLVAQEFQKLFLPVRGVLQFPETIILLEDDGRHTFGIREYSGSPPVLAPEIRRAACRNARATGTCRRS